jgi:hypothetical protein
MKLPGIEPRGVERLTTVGPAAYAQLGAAYQQVGAAVSKAALEAQEVVAQRQGRQAILDLSNKLTAFRAEYGDKRDFTEAELKELGVKLPEKDRWREEVDSSGKRTRVRRETYAAEDYYPQALKRQWEAQAQLAATAITSPGRREKFLADQQALIDNNYLAELERSGIRREARAKVQYEVDIQNARIAGNYDLAAELIRQHPNYTPEVKEQELIKNDQDEEIRLLFRIRENGSLPDIDAQIERLESPTYGQDEARFNRLTPEQREREILALKSKKDALIADAQGRQTKQKGAAFLQLQRLVDDPEASRADVADYISRIAVTQGLSIAEVKALQEYAAGGGKGRYDPRILHDVKARLRDDPTTRTEDLTALMPYVGPEGLMELYAYRATLETEHDRVATDAEILQRQREVLGVTNDTIRKKKHIALAVSRYEMAFTEAVAAEAARTGKPVPPARRMELAQDAARGWLAKDVLEDKRVVEKAWSRDMKISDMPESRRREAIRALRKQGIADPTVGQVVDWLNQHPE